MDVGIKNDDNLVKLATLYQRIMSKQTVDESDVGFLSEEEKEQLMASLEDVAEDLQKKKDDMVDMTEIRQKYGDS
jgi:molecular chaperone DnaK (HSP70)